jgi:hypothetical protein
MHLALSGQWAGRSPAGRSATKSVIHCNQDDGEDEECNGGDPMFSTSQRIWGYETLTDLSRSSAGCRRDS